MSVIAQPKQIQQKVLHICCSFGRGGTEKVFLRFLKAQLKSEVYTPIAVVCAGSWLEEAVQKAEVPYEVITYKKPFLGFNKGHNAAQLSAIVTAQQPSFVQSWATPLHCDVLPTFPVPHLARMALDSKLEEAGDAQTFIAPTPAVEQRLLEAGITREQIYPIPTPVNVPPAGFKEFRYDVRAAYGIPADAFVVLTLGRLHEAKGVDVALCALNVLPERVHMLIVGEGKEHKALQDIAEADGLSERTHFAGWIDNTTPFFAAADAFLLPSRWVSSVNVVLEAWAHQLPVIATSVDGAYDVITNGKTGLLVPPEDDGKLAVVLEQLLNAPELAEKLANAGEAEVKAKLASEKVLPLYEALYKKELQA